MYSLSNVNVSKFNKKKTHILDQIKNNFFVGMYSLSNINVSKLKKKQTDLLVK